MGKTKREGMKGRSRNEIRRERAEEEKKKEKTKKEKDNKNKEDSSELGDLGWGRESDEVRRRDRKASSRKIP